MAAPRADQTDQLDRQIAQVKRHPFLRRPLRRQLIRQDSSQKPASLVTMVTRGHSIFSSWWGANTPPPQSCGPTGAPPDSVNTENEATRGGTLGRSLKIEHCLLDSGSSKFNATDLIMIAWHYTTGQKYELITQTGILLPADIGVEPPEQPILWFSTNPRYEPSAMKPLADANGKLIRMLTLDEMYELGGGLYRFGYPISQLKCGESLRKAAKMSSIWWRRLAKKGASNLKADPADWWGHVGSLSPSEVTVEKMDAYKRWIPVGDRG